ncbi:hypothetical protein [Burkholderia ubonensis]|uniref:hypothetical protein n=1 Tax=Burkholderia ubonensis TaxID=101571 RepID=UPI0012FCAB93|nr:hypothetical protein [Burkholderia ubonensis]
MQALPRQRHDREKGTKPENHSRSAGPVCLWCADAAIAAYPYLGFDAMSTLTEETVEPEKNVPRVIVGIALIGGIISAEGALQGPHCEARTEMRVSVSKRDSQYEREVSDGSVRQVGKSTRGT